MNHNCASQGERSLPPDTGLTFESETFQECYLKYCNPRNSLPAQEKTFVLWGWSNTGTGCPQRLGGVIPGATRSVAGLSGEQPAPADPARARAGTGAALEAPASPKRSGLPWASSDYHLLKLIIHRQINLKRKPKSKAAFSLTTGMSFLAHRKVRKYGQATSNREPAGLPSIPRFLTKTELPEQPRRPRKGGDFCRRTGEHHRRPPAPSRSEAPGERARSRRRRRRQPGPGPAGPARRGVSPRAAAPPRRAPPRPSRRSGRRPARPRRRGSPT